MTAADDVMLRVDLKGFEGNVAYAEYATSKVARALTRSAQKFNYTRWKKKR